MRVRGKFLYGLARPWVSITQFSLSGVHGYSNEFKCVFSERLLCVPQIVTAHICLQLGRCEYVDGGLGT